jgi:hypothetical protein
MLAVVPLPMTMLLHEPAAEVRVIDPALKTLAEIVVIAFDGATARAAVLLELSELLVEIVDLLLDVRDLRRGGSVRVYVVYKRARCLAHSLIDSVRRITALKFFL